MADGEGHPDSGMFGYMVCPFCAVHLHGHGWRRRYLEEEPGRFIRTWIHRKRCPRCRRTYTLIPKGMAAVAQYPTARIAEALAYRQDHGHCSRKLRIPPRTQKRWWRNFTARVRADKGMFPTPEDIAGSIASIGPLSVLPARDMEIREPEELASIGMHPPSPHHRKAITLFSIPC